MLRSPNGTLAPFGPIPPHVRCCDFICRSVAWFALADARKHFVSSSRTSVLIAKFASLCSTLGANCSIVTLETRPPSP